MSFSSATNREEYKNDLPRVSFKRGRENRFAIGIGGNRPLIRPLTFLIDVFSSPLSTPLKSDEMNPQAIRANKEPASSDEQTRVSRGRPISLLILPFRFYSPADSPSSSSSSRSSSPSSPVSPLRPNHSRYATNPNTITAHPSTGENLRLSVLDPSNNHLQVTLIPEDRGGIPRRAVLPSGNFKTFPFH